MPELPEVETVVRGLAPLLLNRRLVRVIARRPDLRWPLPDDLAQRLSGATVTGLRRRAKYGLMDTDRGDSLIFHLGMSGKFHQLGGEAGPHDHVLFELDDRTLAYNDHRRFGSMHLAATAEADAHPLLGALGPEPLGEAFSPQWLAAKAKDRATSIKALILDQQVVSGIGNIYACEALFQARIDPMRAAGTLSAASLRRLVDALKTTLATAIEAGGSTLRDHAQVSGDLGYFQHSFQAYGRESRPCPACATPIKRTPQNGRSTFHCPRCQR